MYIINMPHPCLLPSRRGLIEETVWKCPECGTSFYLIHAAGSGWFWYYTVRGGAVSYFPARRWRKTPRR